MTYRPKRVTFGPPLVRQLPAMIYFGAACIIGIAVIAAPHLPRETWLYQYAVQRDYSRLVSANAFAIFIFTSALAALIRQQMSGVIVNEGGIETREVMTLGLPRVKRYAWPQIDRVRIPPATRAIARQAADETKGAGRITKITLDLWDGTRTMLPDVHRVADLSVTIERVALARSIPIDGGSGLLDELGSPFDEEEG